ncbi:hypothetical protein LENED_012313 [Lentinula edodes]|uniref:Uncharacterized protein n=1 Tax=Lentinula edodes TaxID=5353 RepID=A0A1Q3ESA7_LENED|nr:hypothetical protein LENED_012313 [Lentinula edodes]
MKVAPVILCLVYARNYAVPPERQHTVQNIVRNKTGKRDIGDPARNSSSTPEIIQCSISSSNQYLSAV